MTLVHDNPVNLHCHSRESGNPALATASWIPAQGRDDSSRKFLQAEATRTSIDSRSLLTTQFLGYQVPYLEGMHLMREAMNEIDTKSNQLLLLEHADTITYTRQHGVTSLLLTPDEIKNRGIDLVETDRGGDVTFHGTGQLVGYPVLKLPPNLGVVDYVRKLEQALMAFCKELGVQGLCCHPGKTGVWVGNQKLIAIGVGVSRQVTRHGFALNVSTNLERFTECMVPCGLHGFGVTSLSRLGLNYPLESLLKPLSWHLQQIC